MKNLLLYTLIGFLLIGCGTSKKIIKPPLVSPQQNVLAAAQPLAEQKDTIVTIDTVKEELALDSSLILAINKELTPEEKIIEQKRLGIFKQADWASAMHYDLRKPNFVIIHHTSQNSTAQTIRTFQLPHTKVSSHYVIGKDGQVVQMLNDYDRGWHAGKSKWGAITDMNSVSIGIELDNNGRDPFPEAQIQALLVVLDTLKTRYSIPQLNFIGHGDIAPGRKNDPSVLFPWKKLAEKGFGIWYNEDYLMAPPANFNPIDALKVMGYDMSRPEWAIRAFKQKYIIHEVNAVLSERDIAVLYDLYRKYY